MKLQILSDLHLEFGDMPIPETDADVVIAAGDIHLQEAGVQWLKQFRQPVLYVCGNHEYWQGDFQETQARIKAVCEGSNISFLERDAVEIEGIRFLGASLWTDYANKNQWIMEEAESRINDFKYITYQKRPLKAADLADEYETSVQWLKNEMPKSDKKTVIVTHHAPTQKSWHREKNEGLQFAYCNRLEEWVEACGACLWVHGHTHGTATYQVGATSVVCNPRGYYDKALVDNFDPYFTVNI